MKTCNHKKKILVVDDEFGIRNLLTIYFVNKGYLVYTANSGIEALQKLCIKPDIILLDIMMQDIDGLEVCQLIRNKVPCPILFLTAKVEEQDRIKGLSIGADDYILKPFSIEELHSRIEAHLRREERHIVHTTTLFYGKLWIDYSAKQVGYINERFCLTKKEYEIVEYLSLNKGQVFSKEKIYEHVWGYDVEGDADIAVTEHIKRIRKKLNVCKIDYIETVWGMGYRWKN